MTGQQYEEIQSLAECLRMTLTDLVSLAHLVAGDEPLRWWSDLSFDGAAELLSVLRTYTEIDRDWVERLIAA